MSDVTASNTSVATETARAEAAETALGTQITTETGRAEASELTLTGSISAEVTRATGAESTLSTAISTETSRAEAAETTLTNGKANLAGGNTFTTAEQILAASATGYASINVPAGVAPANPLAGDVFLITGGDNHIQFIDPSSTAQEIAYMSDVTASNTSVATETARAEAAETALGTQITTETGRAEASELTLTGSISAEVTRATGAESTLSTAISTETSRAEAAETTLTNGKANLAGGNTFTTGEQILAASATGYASINVPAGVAPANPLAGDVFLITGGDNHIQFIDPSSTAQEIAYMSDVTASNTSVATETARAEAAETALGTQITTETGRAEASELTLTGSISAEVTRATGAESTLSTAISTETSRAEAAETTLTNGKANLAGGNTFTTGEQILAASATGYASINVPAGVAPANPLAGDVFLITGGDNHIQFIDPSSTAQEIAYMSDVTASNTSVATETARAEAAETALGTQITTETGRAEASELTLTGSISAEVTRATGAESTLSTAISTETSRAEAAETTLTNGKANLAGGNTFTTGEQILAASATGYASINVPAGVAPANPLAGDVFLITGGDNHIQFIDPSSTAQEIAYMSDVTASNTSVATETARAAAAETALGTQITTETGRAEASELTLTGSISAEVTRATGAESTLSTAISTETSRAEAAETTLTNGKANLAGGNTFTTGEQILAASATGYASINVPAGVAPANPLAGDVFLITGGDNHIQFIDPSSTAQEIAYMSDVTASNTSVATETARAAAAETALGTQITTETGRAEASELTLTGSISAEVTRATGAESTLSTAISTETSRAEA